MKMKFISILYLPPSVLFVKTNENHRILHALNFFFDNTICRKLYHLNKFSHFRFHLIDLLLYYYKVEAFLLRHVIFLNYFITVFEFNHKIYFLIQKWYFIVFLSINRNIELFFIRAYIFVKIIYVKIVN